jgi:hypothetical protein
MQVFNAKRLVWRNTTRSTPTGRGVSSTRPWWQQSRVADLARAMEKAALPQRAAQRNVPAFNDDRLRSNLDSVAAEPSDVAAARRAAETF